MCILSTKQKEAYEFAVSICDMIDVPAPTKQQWCEFNKITPTVEETYGDDELELGDYVFDEISGFTGQIISIYFRLGGTTRVEVQPKCKETNVLPQAEWFELDNLSEVNNYDK